MIIPRTRQDLWLFIYHHFGVKLPWRSFTPGHSSPFDFVADAFFDPARDVAAWACRSGGKTLGASIIAALEYLFTNRLQGRVLSGSEDQAKNLYEYWRRWCNGVLVGRLDGPVNRLLTQIGGGRFEILAASQKRVRGPKVQRLFEDELDEIDSDVDAAAAGMIDSRTNTPGRTVYTSTWHRADGLMGRLIERCPDNGVRLHKWNLWEAIERCPRQRHEDGAGCERCGLGPACLAKARENETPGSQASRSEPNEVPRCVGVAAEATGLYSIDDAIKAYSKVGRATWEAEYECRRPSVEGQVYREFDDLRHRCTEPPAELTIYRAIDWGHRVFVCLWIGEDKNGVAYLLDTYRAEAATIHQHAEYVKAHPLRDVKDSYCDPAGRNKNDQTGRSNIEIFKERGIRCSYTLSPRLREVHNGIRLVRAAIRPAVGQPRLYYVPNDNNRIFVKAMQNYHNRKVNGVWLDDPAKPQEFEHIPDALRYYYVNRQVSASVGVVRVAAS